MMMAQLIEAQVRDIFQDFTKTFCNYAWIDAETMQAIVNAAVPPAGVDRDQRYGYGLESYSSHNSTSFRQVNAIWCSPCWSLRQPAAHTTSYLSRRESSGSTNQGQCHGIKTLSRTRSMKSFQSSSGNCQESRPENYFGLSALHRQKTHFIFFN